MPRADAKTDAYNHSLFLYVRKFPASSLFLFCAATNKPDFRQIAEASSNHSWILHLALSVATPLCVLFVTRYRVYFADYDTR
jgi:hypothetical protein